MASFYLKSCCTENDIAALVSYLSAITDLELLHEVIEVVKHMIEIPGDNQGRMLQMLAGKKLLQLMLIFTLKHSLAYVIYCAFGLTHG